MLRWQLVHGIKIACNYEMPLTAKTKEGYLVYSWHVKDQREEFYCKNCGEQLSLIRGDSTINHFSHQRESHCEPEPETSEHAYAKKTIFEALSTFDRSYVQLEYNLGRQKVDVYWDKGSSNFSTIFEVQAAELNIAEFEQKINLYLYRKKHIAVYIFVGNRYLRRAEDNSYLLTEIERKIFFEKAYHDTVIGAYFYGGLITIPRFSRIIEHPDTADSCEKFALDMQETKQTTLKDFLNDMYFFKPQRIYSPECPHAFTKHIKHIGSRKGYKVLCKDCDSYTGWIKESKMSTNKD